MILNDFISVGDTTTTKSQLTTQRRYCQLERVFATTLSAPSMFATVIPAPW